MKRCGLLVAGFLAACFLMGLRNPSANAMEQEILVAAAASLREALSEIGRAYESSTRQRVLFTFGASSSLARQIEQGAPVDLFISADLQKMEQLAGMGLIEPLSRINLLGNVLVMVVSDEADRVVRSPKDLLRKEVEKIALAEPSSVPAGIYARTYLEGQGLWNSLKRKIIPVRDVRAALTAVESGNADASFVYRTDATISKKLKPAYEIPRKSGVEIVYPVALIKGSKLKPQADRFQKFLLSPSAKASFQKYGFLFLQ